MSDKDAFPSGPWHGFYTYSSLPARRFRMDLSLDFSNGRIAGEGIDNIGRFVIRGSYDAGSLRCSWHKTYIGRHTVFYDGAWDMGSIWGLWTLPGTRGGFRIWPGKRGEGEARYVETEEEIPVEELDVVGTPLRSDT